MRYCSTWSARSAGNLARLPLALALGARVRRHVQQVDDPGQLVLDADRQMDRHALRAELGAKLLEGAVEVGALAVEHVDEDDAREPERLGAAPVARGLHLDPHDAADRDERALHDVQRRDRVALEARLAGRVDQVDLPALPLEVAQRRRDRHLALLLVVVPVGDGRALLDDAEPVRRACLEEHCLDERGLAGASVTDDGDVADLSGLDCGHAGAPPGLVSVDLNEASVVETASRSRHEAVTHARASPR